MIVYNITFALLLLMLFGRLYTTHAYISTIRAAMAIAIVPAVKQALLKNKHHRESARKALKEYQINRLIWVPLTTGALGVLAFVWFNGFANNWELTSVDVIMLVVALTPPLARQYTHEIDVQWLTVWAAGLQAVLIGCQVEALQKRVAELEQIENIEENQEAFIELANLRTVLSQVDSITQQIPDELKQPAEKGP